MFQVAKLSHLKILNLAHNSIVTMEGLKDLKLLTWLSLASNSIKGIEQLNQNVHLEHLDLSDNAIPSITDISYLRNLKVRTVHKHLIRAWRITTGLINILIMIVNKCHMGLMDLDGDSVDSNAFVFLHFKTHKHIRSGNRSGRRHTRDKDGAWLVDGGGKDDPVSSVTTVHDLCASLSTFANIIFLNFEDWHCFTCQGERRRMKHHSVGRSNWMCKLAVKKRP